jgi:hypothetical protein
MSPELTHADYTGAAYPGPFIPAHRLRALADEVEEAAARLERRGAPDLDTGRRWDEQAARARVEATGLRQRAKVLWIYGSRRGLIPPGILALRRHGSAPRSPRIGAGRRVTRRSTSRAGPSSSSSDDDPPHDLARPSWGRP